VPVIATPSPPSQTAPIRTRTRLRSISCSPRNQTRRTPSPTGRWGKLPAAAIKVNELSLGYFNCQASKILFSILVRKYNNKTYTITDWQAGELPAGTIKVTRGKVNAFTIALQTINMYLKLNTCSEENTDSVSVCTRFKKNIFPETIIHE
jgi:hypothetical protein